MNYVFVRIPRTASTSICKALNNFPNHKTAVQWREKLGDEWNDCFKFSIVRDPYERFISMYQYFKVSFAEFGQDKRFIPQVDYLYEKGKLMVDYVGRFEELNQSWKYIRERLGMGNTILKHLKKSPENKPKLSLSQKETVYHYYRSDFKFLGYK